MQAPAATSSEFPSVLADDTIEPSPYHAALYHLRQGLQALFALSPGADAGKREEHEQIVSLLKQVLQLLHVHFAPEGDDSGFRSFGEVLRQHRDEAGMTQEQLADYAGLSLSYIRKLEQGTKPPARNAVLALCSVADLKLVPSEVTMLPAIRESSHKHAPNWYVSPGFDSVQMMADLAQQLNGGGGSIEQTYVYLDHKSASDWIQLCNMPSYVSMYRESFPHSQAAELLRELTGNVGLDVIALGPGDGKTEVRLVEHILEEGERPSVRFYLFDVSQPLLSRAFKHAVDTFSDQPKIFVCGIQGNFHHLPRYMQLHYTPARSHRRRVYVLVGNTIGNIDHEPQFFQSAFAGAVPGDILLFDIQYAFSASDNAADIERLDPALQKPIPEAHQRWLAGPIERYCRDVQDIKFSWRVDTNRPLPGSYGLQFMAQLTLPGMQHKSFHMFNVRRYAVEGLVRCLQRLDWEHVGLLPFSSSKARPRGLLMFRKKLPIRKH